MDPALEEAGGQNLEPRGLGLPRAGGLCLLRDRWRELRVYKWWGADAVGERHGAVLGHLLSSVASKELFQVGVGTTRLPAGSPQAGSQWSLPHSSWWEPGWMRLLEAGSTWLGSSQQNIGNEDQCSGTPIMLGKLLLHLLELFIRFEIMVFRFL